jgi:hypothetical protein
MSSIRREYHVDYRTKKAALFFLAFDANPSTRVKIPDAMRIKGYSPSEAADRSLQQQVHREADKIKGEAIPGSWPFCSCGCCGHVCTYHPSKMGNVANRRVLYQQFTYGGEEEEDDASIPAPLTDADEASWR